MREHHLVAIYPTNTDAGHARDALIGSGFSADAIRTSSDAGSALGESGPAKETTPAESYGGFLSWLFGSDVPAREREWYGGQFRGGRTAVSVKVASEEDHRRAEEILDAFGAVDLEYDSDETSTGQTPAGAESPAQSSPSAEEIIPIVKEELAVGKRVTEKHHYIRTHVIEQPAEAQVGLKDETMVVERRPTSGQTQAGGLEDREVEIIEKHEEPVVEKRTRADEELVVRKDVKHRTETIKDKVRETKVDIEGQPNISPDIPRK